MSTVRAPVLSSTSKPTRCPRLASHRDQVINHHCYEQVNCCNCEKLLNTSILLSATSQQNQSILLHPHRAIATTLPANDAKWLRGASKGRHLNIRFRCQETNLVSMRILVRQSCTIQIALDTQQAELLQPSENK